MMLLTARMRWFRWDVTHAFAFRLAITVFTIVLLCTVAQVNSSSLSGGRKFLLSRDGQHDAYFGGCCCERGPSQLSATALLHHPVRRPRHLGRRHFPVIAGRRQRRRIDFGDDRLFAPLPSDPPAHPRLLRRSHRNSDSIAHHGIAPAPFFLLGVILHGRKDKPRRRNRRWTRSSTATGVLFASITNFYEF